MFILLISLKYSEKYYIYFLVKFAIPLSKLNK